MADTLLYVDSMSSDKYTDPFVSRQVTYVIDQNNQSYSSNQILWDLSALSNSGRWCSWSEAYMVLPLVAVMYRTTNDTNWASKKPQFGLAFKGFHHLIDSWQVEFNQTTVIQLTRLTNVYVTYKLLKSFSQDDLHKIAPTIGFYPDSSLSWDYKQSASADYDCYGSINNRSLGFENLYPNNNINSIFTSAQVTNGNSPLSNGTSAAGAAFTTLYTNVLPRLGAAAYFPAEIANHGMYQRQKFCTFVNAAPWTSILTEANARQVAQNYFDMSSTYSNSGTNKIWFYNAIIRLKDIADLFGQLPLVKGLYVRLILNINTATVQLDAEAVAAGGSTIADATPAYISLSQSSTTLSNSTCPFMVASTLPGQANYGVFTASNSYLVKCGISNVTTTGCYSGDTVKTIQHPLSSCRLYIPLYVMSPSAEQTYLSANRTKTITYTDIYQFQQTGVTSGSTISWLVSNGIINPRSIVVVPFYNAASNKTNSAGTIATSPIASTFASEPNTTSPLCVLTDFNVQLAGVNQFMLNEVYDFSNFLDECQQPHSLNGGLVTGLTSGLITEQDWIQNKRYYVCNLARRLSAEDSVPKSILVLGRNITQVTLDLYAYVECERSITIELQSGQLMA